MSKEELDDNSNNIEHTSNEVETKKKLCVHELKRRLKKKSKERK
jgi:hypothetical protein